MATVCAVCAAVCAAGVQWVCSDLGHTVCRICGCCTRQGWGGTPPRRASSSSRRNHEPSLSRLLPALTLTFSLRPHPQCPARAETLALLQRLPHVTGAFVERVLAGAQKAGCAPDLSPLASRRSPLSALRAALSALPSPPSPPLPLTPDLSLPHPPSSSLQPPSLPPSASAAPVLHPGSLLRTQTVFQDLDDH
eukprot:393364-Rhodomonas_salina.2